MRFWDTSAVVPLVVDEESTSVVLQEFRDDPEMAVWWATETECVSALTRLEREGQLSADEMTEALARLAWLSTSWLEVQPVEKARRTAVRLLRVHPLRAADALQLGAAILAAEGDPATLDIVTFDERLALAAQREGFRVLRPQA